jgi:hypothetical protein
MGTSVFKKSNHPTQEARCFSLITKDRSVDLEAHSVPEQAKLVACFRQLVAAAAAAGP